MTEHERQSLQNISAQMAPQIRELVETKISENLRALYNETSLKLINLANTMKKSTDDFCNTLLVDRNRLTEQVEEIKNAVNMTVEKQNRIVQHEQSFSKVCKNAFS